MYHFARRLDVDTRTQAPDDSARKGGAKSIASRCLPCTFSEKRVPTMPLPNQRSAHQLLSRSPAFAKENLRGEQVPASRTQRFWTNKSSSPQTHTQILQLQGYHPGLYHKTTPNPFHKRMTKHIWNVCPSQRRIFKTIPVSLLQRWLKVRIIMLGDIQLGRILRNIRTACLWWVHLSPFRENLLWFTWWFIST